MPRLRLLLTVWFLLVSTGLTLAHRHVGGSLPHAHAVGLCLATPDTHSPDTLHSHLILLGVELDGPLPATGAAEAAHSLLEPGSPDAPPDLADLAAAPAVNWLVLDLSLGSARGVDRAAVLAVAPIRSAVLRL